jgi:nicotinamidase-related amidase
MTRLAANCWGERTFEFDPEKTALIVIDMQRHFLEHIEEEPEAGATAVEVVAENSGSAEQAEQVEAAAALVTPDATSDTAPETEPEEEMNPEELIERVGRLLAWARGTGCRVYHTREGYSSDLSDVSAFRQDLDYVGHPGPLGRSLIRGELGHDFVADLQPLPGEPIIDKASFGAFYRTDLEEQLRAAGVERLILCGVTTQCCVHSTLREAVDRGYWCLTVADCCAASEQGLHDAALMLIAGEGHLFGWIADLADLEAAGAAALV